MSDEHAQPRRPVRAGVRLLVGSLAVAAVFAAGWWAGRTALQPPTDPLDDPRPVVVEAGQGVVGERQSFVATSEWRAASTYRVGDGGTVTGLEPARTSVTSGDVLLDIDLRPVVMAAGEVPALRSLGEGTVGPDVEQFEGLLASAGHGPEDVDAIWDDSTTQALHGWQDANDYPRTDGVPLGTVIFVPDLPVRVRTLAQVGETLPPGAPVVEVLEQSPSFRIPVTEEQVALVPTGSAVALSGEGTSFSGVIGSPERTEEGLFLPVDGPESASLCAPSCAAVPVSMIVQWQAQVDVVPPSEGVVLPLAAIRVDAQGQQWVLTEAGQRRSVTVGTSAGGRAVVEGIEAGARELVDRGWLVRQSRPGRATVYIPRVPTGVADPSAGSDSAPGRPVGRVVADPSATTTSVPRQYGDGDAREDPDPEPDDDGWAEVDPEVQAFDLIGQATYALGCSPAEFTNRDHPAFGALLDQIAAELRDGGDHIAIFARLTRRPAPASVESWAGLLRHRLGTQTAPVPS